MSNWVAAMHILLRRINSKLMWPPVPMQLRYTCIQTLYRILISVFIDEYLWLKLESDRPCQYTI